MTPSEWQSHVWTVIRLEQYAGCSINDAVATALNELAAGSWQLSMESDQPPSCAVLLHDLKEVAHRICEIHDELEKKLPTVLDEMAAIKPNL